MESCPKLSTSTYNLYATTFAHSAMPARSPSVSMLPARANRESPCEKTCFGIRPDPSGAVFVGPGARPWNRWKIGGVADAP